jgi:hypothetical protein
MKMKNRMAKQVAIALLCAVMASACSNNAATTSTATSTEAAVTTAGAAATTGTTATGTATTATVQQVDYDENDAYSDWSAADATEIKLNGSGAAISGSGAEAAGSAVTITAAGTYVLSGTLDEGQIIVDVAKTDNVRLILNGVDIHNSSSSAIYVKEADKVIISLQEGTENKVSDGAEYVFPDADTDEPNATIFSKGDLTINGSGKLVVEANYNNGITSKDDLKITGGAIEVTAADDALMGRDLLAVQAGEITVKATGHGLKTTNDNADSLGYLAIDGGTFNIESGQDALHSIGGLHVAAGTVNISAGDDAIHSDTSIAITGGTIDIAESYEGIEAPVIDIAGGDIALVSSDDGLNAAGGIDDATATEAEAEGGQPAQAGPGGGGQPGGGNSSYMITISGGSLSVNAGGDGLDSNGSIEMSGGTVVVHGPTENNNGSLDYDGTFNMTGGVLIAAGSSGMVQATSDQSTQAGILMTYTAAQQAGTLLHLADSDGNAIATFAPAKNYQAVFISSPSIKQDGTYTLYSGGTSTGTEQNGLYTGGQYQGGTKVVEFTQASMITWLNESGVTEARSGMGMGGFGGGGGRGQGGGRGGMMGGAGGTPPEGAGGTPPEGGIRPEGDAGGMGGMPPEGDAGMAQPEA